MSTRFSFLFLAHSFPSLRRFLAAFRPPSTAFARRICRPLPTSACHPCPTPRTTNFVDHLRSPFSTTTFRHLVDRSTIILIRYLPPSLSTTTFTLVCHLRQPSSATIFVEPHPPSPFNTFFRHLLRPVQPPPPSRPPPPSCAISINRPHSTPLLTVRARRLRRPSSTVTSDRCRKLPLAFFFHLHMHSCFLFIFQSRMSASSLTSREHSHPALPTRSERSTRPSAERLCRQHIHREYTELGL